MDDSDRTPRFTRPRSHWDDEQRAQVGAEHRRRAAAGVPVVADEESRPDEITSPVELLERELLDCERATLERTKRRADEPATFADVLKLAETLTRARREERSNSAERANQLLALLNRPPDAVTADLITRVDGVDVAVTGLAATVAGHRRLIRWIAAAAVGSLVAVGGFVYARGFTEGSTAVRLDRLERDLEDIRSDLRALGRRSDATRISPATSPASLFTSTAKDFP